MFNGIVNKGSTGVDILEVLSGIWNEYDSGEWHVVKTPMFLVLEATLDPGASPLPFSFKVPVAATVAGTDGSVAAVIVRPGDTVFDMPFPGVATIQVFGDRACPRALLS